MILAISLIGALLLSVAGMLGLLMLVRRHPWARNLRATNDIAGFYVTLFGALYGVFIGFMVLAVWTRFDQAETLTEREATELVSVYALTSDLPETIREPIRRDITAYTKSVVSDEFPAMAAGRYHAETTFHLVNDLWRDVAKIRPTTMSGQVVMEQIFSSMRDMYEARRLRLLSNTNRLPIVFWIVLIAGGFITVGSTSLFGVERFSFHAVKTALLTALICLILFAIWEVDLPFRDAVHVTPEAFERDLTLFQEIEADEANEIQKSNNQHTKNIKN